MLCCALLCCMQLTKWFTWFVLVAFLTTAVFWVTRLNKVRTAQQLQTCAWACALHTPAAAHLGGMTGLRTSNQSAERPKPSKHGQAPSQRRSDRTALLCG